MKSSTERWVIGDDFCDREEELEILDSKLRERNHVLLSDQRRWERPVCCATWIGLTDEISYGSLAPAAAVEKGAFRVMITVIYNRLSAVAEARKLPAFQAVHIHRYTNGGKQEPKN